MGRPPIGKVAMTSTERSRRYRAGMATKPVPATKPAATKPAEPATKPEPDRRDEEIARLQTWIAELQADLARERTRRETEVGRLRAAAEQRHPESRGAAVKEDTKLMKLIRRLHSPENDNEAAGALRKLASELQARKRGFQELADLTAQWDQEDAAVRPPKPKPVDWPKVESVIKTYAEGKTKVNINKLVKALNAEVPALKEQQERRAESGFIVRCLRGLGFVQRGEFTFERR